MTKFWSCDLRTTHDISPYVEFMGVPKTKHIFRLLNRWKVVSRWKKPTNFGYRKQTSSSVLIQQL
ncbi:hypothetical protein M6B38_397165 [Iris pallida]|uniref:Uncharacterized protein n=1 Tax=Iris pallida TaxID=29817 RepID=A0AAX6FWR5_IRIPA|nr:hypothetical protein M6B38_397165 [Iris pallida]